MLIPILLAVIIHTKITAPILCFAITIHPIIIVLAYRSDCQLSSQLQGINITEQDPNPNKRNHGFSLSERDRLTGRYVSHQKLSVPGNRIHSMFQIQSRNRLFYPWSDNLCYSHSRLGPRGPQARRLGLLLEGT
jgi:hypothetical protein